MGSFAPVPDDGPLRLVLVGAGNMGRAWLRTILGTPTVRLVGLVDLDLDLAHRAATENGLDVVVGDSLTTVAAQSGAQAVVDVTVPPAHHAVNTEALMAGLPVLCEKPIAPTVAETLSLIATEEVSGQLLMTSQSRRYYPALAKLKSMTATLGDIGIVTTEFFKAPHFGGFRDEMEHPLLVDMAIHAFDAVRYLLDADPVSVDCRTFNPSWSWYRGDAAANAIFTFEGGTRYAYAGSWCSPGLETSWNGSWRVSGARGTAVWDGDGDPDVAHADDGGAPAGEVPANRSEIGEVPAIRPEIAGALDEFVSALRTGETPSGDVHSNVHSLAMVEAAVLSAATGRTVELAGVLEDAYRAALVSERRDDVREALRSWGSASARTRVGEQSKRSEQSLA
ncbi:Gfo/Idh/MocA family oxidoreductase [Paenarthrobacter sp. DKR-5]|uniref:Gfo/Idh/MocA family protein n=1 Tax=Paenarthrobacter sp. DKR-5 TaxID=2835535 RepID=UPI001BDD5633|nr:Gfo/Idh/MocA family oxidoreductase [Paenarthrobacter sp. DKR-5]MBT1002507.1 Gfo/Idh/MocA family oxidoreductase [Paenarthrobacter sp. DKR-5]